MPEDSKEMFKFKNVSNKVKASFVVYADISSSVHIMIHCSFTDHTEEKIAGSGSGFRMNLISLLRMIT